MLKYMTLAFSLMAFISLLTTPSFAQNRFVPNTQQQIQLSFAPIVKKVAPAVVNIYAKKVVRRQGRISPLFNDPFFRRFFGDRFSGIPRDRVENSLGSGVIVDPTGIVVTNNHVIANATEVVVVLPDRRQFEAKIETADKSTDLAILKIETKDPALPFVTLKDSDDLEVGDLVLAIGNPFGVGQTVTSGIVSALARTAVGVSDASFFIQTDAAINPGNSGGALVSMDGRLIGVNTAIYSRDGGSLGIGFAVPSNMVQTVLESARRGGPVVRPWVGFKGKEVTNDLAEGLGLPRPKGVLVERVHANGPAAKAGIRVGDVVLSVEGQEINSPQGLRYRLFTKPMGRSVALEILRRGKTIRASMRLQPPPEDPPRNDTMIKGHNPFSGAMVANLSPALANELELDDSASGVVILSIQRGSLAARLNIRPGDRILQISKKAVSTVGALQKLVKQDRRNWHFAIDRGGRVIQANIRL